MNVKIDWGEAALFLFGVLFLFCVSVLMLAGTTYVVWITWSEITGGGC